ncbi:MAG: NAD(P)/FAD-dependent oxidoreductase [Opitutales bacterium]
MPAESTSPTDVLIVGAGIAGLTTARELQRGGLTVRLLDKGRGFGGRMAHRRGEGVAFDHGAQFFTVRDPAFQAIVDAWLEAGVADEWHRLPPTQAHPQPLIRYRGTPAMTAPAKFLAEDLDVRRSTRVESVAYSETGWSALTESGERFHATWLILTMPPPQALTLLGDESLGKLPEADAAFLREVHYERTLALLVALNGPSALKAPGLRKGDLDEPLELVADNYLKGVSPAPGALTIHASNAYSEKHYDSPDDVRIPPLLDAAQPFFGDSAVVEARAHRWGYATPLNRPHPDRGIVVPELKLALAGDAFGGARVEGPVLSGLAVAARLRQAS